MYASPRMSTQDEKERLEFLQGTMDMLILRTLLLGPAHGHAIAHAIERNSDEVLQVEQGLCIRAAPPDQAWLDSGGGGRFREQPPGEILPPHSQRKKATRH